MSVMRCVGDARVVGAFRRSFPRPPGGMSNYFFMKSFFDGSIAFENGVPRVVQWVSDWDRRVTRLLAEPSDGLVTYRANTPVTLPC